MRWASHNNVRVTISSVIDPDKTEYRVMLALRNVLRPDSLLDEVPVTACGTDKDDAAKAMVERLRSCEVLYLVDNNKKITINERP